MWLRPLFPTQTNRCASHTSLKRHLKGFCGRLRADVGSNRIRQMGLLLGTWKVGHGDMWTFPSSWWVGLSNPSEKSTTLPETNSSHLKWWFPINNLLFHAVIFRCELLVSGRVVKFAENKDKYCKNHHQKGLPWHTRRPRNWVSKLDVTASLQLETYWAEQIHGNDWLIYSQISWANIIYWAIADDLSII